VGHTVDKYADAWKQMRFWRGLRVAAVLALFGLPVGATLAMPVSAVEFAAYLLLFGLIMLSNVVVHPTYLELPCPRCGEAFSGGFRLRSLRSFLDVMPSRCARCGLPYGACLHSVEEKPHNG
jgi:hypothetical protein